MPASASCTSATSETAAPEPVTMFTTPGGSPAASRSSRVIDAESCWVGLGFHTTVLPISTGAKSRFAAMDVKLKGEIASTNPSSGRWSVWFHCPRGETRGWRA